MRRIILKYYPLLTIIIPFVLFIIPTAFINNNYLNLAIAQHIDSGALLESLFSMLKKDSFYNQNVGYQSSFYGFPFNSLLFWWFVFLNKLLKLDIVRDFPIYATSSRIISTLISVIILWIVYIFSSKFYKSNKIAFVITFLLAIFPGFSFYSTIVKPDQAALLFCIISFYFMYRFLLSNKSINYISAAILSFLALFTKQPYVFLFIPLFFGYWLNNNKITKITSLSIQLLKNFLITLLVLLPIIFIIHPYIFLHPQTYIFRQKQLTNMFNAPISENFKYWIILYKNWPIILIGYFSSFFFSISYFFVKSKSKQVKILFLLSTFILIYTSWLTLKVGPIRGPAYLMPNYLASLFVIFFLLKQAFIFVKKNLNNKTYFIIKFSLFVILFVTITVIFINSTLFIQDSVNTINESSYSFNNSLQVQVAKNLISSKIYYKPINQTKVVYSASIPVVDHQYKEIKNNWLFGTDVELIINLVKYNPDIIIIDTSKWYELPFEKWNFIAKKIGLTKTRFYSKSSNSAINNTYKENESIIIYYK